MYLRTYLPKLALAKQQNMWVTNICVCTDMKETQSLNAEEVYLNINDISYLCHMGSRQSVLMGYIRVVAAATAS